MNLEVVVNDPFDAAKIEPLFFDREDLQLAAPRSKFPFCCLEWTERFQRHPENCSLLFLLEEMTIGHTSFLPNAEQLYLCYVILHPDHRGKQIAGEMLRLSEEFCRLNYPHAELYLNVNRKNQRARLLYEKSGYEICEEVKDKFKMRKRLKP